MKKILLYFLIIVFSVFSCVLAWAETEKPAPFGSGIYAELDALQNVFTGSVYAMSYVATGTPPRFTFTTSGEYMSGETEGSICFSGDDNQTFCIGLDEAGFIVMYSPDTNNLRFGMATTTFTTNSVNFVPDIIGNIAMSFQGGTTTGTFKWVNSLGYFRFQNPVSIDAGQFFQLKELGGAYVGGSANVCVYDDGTLFASDAACP
jgi:hypothetical protein